MANYRLGTNRILYGPNGTDPDNVSVVFIRPDLTVSEESFLTKVNSIVFYIDVDFTKVGDYLAIFSENGVERTPSNFKVDSPYITPMSTLVNCQDCFYWVNGECHRKSPKLWVVNNTSGDSITKWPLTLSTDNCAEGAPKNNI